MKSLQTLRWSQIADVAECIKTYKQKGYTIYGLEQCHGSQSLHDIAFQFPALLILGEEVQGIEDSLLAFCDHMVEIPMYGSAHSLNVSVASGVVLYQVLHQWQKI